MKATSLVLAMAVLVVAAPAPSDAKPLPTCKAMCKRLTECKLPGYTQRCLDTCKPHEASAEGRAQILTFTRYTCQQIKSAIAGASTQGGEATDDADLDAANQVGDDDVERDRPSRDNCAPVCDRFAQCRLWKRDSCMGYCSAHTSNPAKNLSAAQWSCPKLGAWMQELGVSGSASGSGRWTCVAEGSSGTASDSGPMQYQNHRWPDTGKTRDEASRKALDGCSALVRNYVTVGAVTGSRAESGTCRVVDCQQPGK